MSLWRKFIWGSEIGVLILPAASCGTCDREIRLAGDLRKRLEEARLYLVDNPAEADIVVISGTITVRLRDTILRTVAMVPAPRVIVALGECALTGGPFRESPAVVGPLRDILAVEVTIPGCPPSDDDIYDGLQRALATLRDK